MEELGNMQLGPDTLLGPARPCCILNIQLPFGHMAYSLVVPFRYPPPPPLTKSELLRPTSIAFPGVFVGVAVAGGTRHRVNKGAIEIGFEAQYSERWANTLFNHCALNQLRTG